MTPPRPYYPPPTIIAFSAHAELVDATDDGEKLEGIGSIELLDDGRIVVRFEHPDHETPAELYFPRYSVCAGLEPATLEDVYPRSAA